jgi:hypothetical protein
MAIPIVYFRSSSFNAHRGCPMSYYTEYVLGLRGNGNKKADKGTITHKILEVCALCKKAEQDGIKVIDDGEIGLVETDNYDPEYLAAIASRVYQYYVNKFDYHTGKNVWTERDFKDCLSWAWKVLKYRDGMFDPRNRNVVDAEPHFDFELPFEWAAYDYPKLGLKGNLALKGTIDLITDVGDGVYEVIDYKTGMRKDWATGKEKNQSNLYDDPQLRLYHYACKHMYPDVNTFLITIYYINTGGPFTIHLQDSDMKKTEEIIRRRYEEIKNTEVPLTIKETDPKSKWKCRKICHAGMTTFEDTHVEPMTEGRWGQHTSYGCTMCKCEQIRYMIKKKGIEWVTDNYTHPDHVHGSYGEGGGKVQDGNNVLDQDKKENND